MTVDPAIDSSERGEALHARRTLLVDAHVHFHPGFEVQTFLAAAASNFQRGRSELRIGGDCAGCLLLTESAGASFYETLLDSPTPLPSGWELHQTGDDACCVIRHPREDATLLFVAGRQIITAENLEVLAVGCRLELRDGLPVRDVLQLTNDAGALPILPWGFGKWLGRRGEIVRTLILSKAAPFCLGDNAGRPAFMPRPALFREAESCGIPVLPGSDPLPLSAHVNRPGSFGFVLDPLCPDERPSAAIKDRLRSLRQSPRSFGSLSTLGGALCSQIGLRLARCKRRVEPGT